MILSDGGDGGDGGVCWWCLLVLMEFILYLLFVLMVWMVIATMSWSSTVRDGGSSTRPVFHKCSRYLLCSNESDFRACL